MSPTEQPNQINRTTTEPRVTRHIKLTAMNTASHSKAAFLKLPKSLCKHIQILTQERPQQLLSASQAYQNHLNTLHHHRNRKHITRPAASATSPHRLKSRRHSTRTTHFGRSAHQRQIRSNENTLNNQTKPAYPHSPTRKASEPRNAKWSTTRDALLKTPSFSAIQAPSSHIRSKNGSLNPLTTAPVHA